MSRKDQVLADARADSLGLDNPQRMAHNAIDGGVPIENQDWKPPATLETPPAPAGYKYTWVRTAYRKDGSFPDADNLRKMQSQGWRPVLRADIPEGYFTPTVFDARFNNGQETVGVGDSVLMKIPLRMKRQRDAYYAAMANRQIQGIDKVLHAEAQRPGDKFFAERSTKTELRKAPLDDTDE